MADASRKSGAIDIMVKQLIAVFMGLLALLLGLIIAGAIGDRYYSARGNERKIELDKQEAFAAGMTYQDYLRMMDARQPKARPEGEQAGGTAQSAQEGDKSSTSALTSALQTPKAGDAQPATTAAATAAATTPASADASEDQTPTEPPIAKGQLILPKPDLTVTVAEMAEMKNKAAVICTTLGNVPVELYADKAPQTVKNFIYLARNGFYNGICFHRMIPGGMVEAGSPNARRGGTAGYWFPEETTNAPALIGTIAMLPAPETSLISSEFALFVAEGGAYGDQTSVFGRILDRFDVAQKIADAVCDRNGYIEDRVYITRVDIVDKSTVAPKVSIWESFDRGLPTPPEPTVQ